MQINLAFLRTGTKNKEYIRKKSRQAALEIGVTTELHIVVSVQRLHILRMRHLDSLQLTRFVELLTTTELFYDTRLIEFAFEFLNRALDVITFFNRNDNHCIHLLSSYPGPGSNRHGFPLVFETNASTYSATWAFAFGKKVAVVYTAPLNKRATSASALPKN